MLTAYDQVVDHFRDYYVKLLGTSDPMPHKVHPDIISEGPILSIEHQLSLLHTVTVDEIKEALWSIPVEKSPGPDGFSS